MTDRYYRPGEIDGKEFTYIYKSKTGKDAKGKTIYSLTFKTGTGKIVKEYPALDAKTIKNLGLT